MFRLLLFTILSVSSPAKDSENLRLNENNVHEIIDALTVEEKCKLIIGGRAAMFKPGAYTKIKAPGAAGVINEVPRLGIPGIVLADGPAGVRIRPHRPNDERTFYCTGFPIGSLVSSTWDTEVVENAGVAMGREAKEYGVNVLLTPGINIHRNPLCGRNFEYYSEDPLLSGKIAAAMINGIESEGVGSSLKHFAVNNQETNRLANNSKVSERAMREIYLKGFEIAVKEAQPWTIMSSYNYINGEHASESHRLLTQILRDEWGFEGVVMSDWGAGYDIAAQIHAGNDLIQPGSDERYYSLLQAVNDGSLSMEDLDRSVERILRLNLRTNRFKGIPFSEAPDLEEGAQASRRIAEEGIVLLKNKSGALPIAKDRKVALFGVTSYDFIPGGTGSGDVHRPYTVDLKEGLANEGFVLDKDVDRFYSGYMADEKMRCDRINGDNGWQIDRERAIEVTPSDLIRKAAETSDCAVITFGRVFGEGKDRNYHYNYLLSKDENRLLDEVSDAFHAKGKKVTVILNIGGYIDVWSWQKKADGIILCWLPGQEGGNAVASVVSGSVNPSGHLPSTMSKDYWQEPSAENFPILYADKPFNYSFYRQLDGSVRDLIKDIDYTEYKEGIYVGYRYFNTFKKRAIAYPFGHGLSYTDFKFGKMTVRQAENGWNVTVNVKNTGKVAGKDVVQIYVKAPRKGLDKPERELKGFAKTPLLAPGESCEVKIFISKESLASFDESAGTWVTEKGRYTFIAAKNSLDNSRRKRLSIR
ncbi:MAG: beta-glucosidase [Bacteroidales bacterium]|nr:beta-glucosidase [Bacteroidales bacterium]